MVVLEAGSRCLKVDKVQFSYANGERFTLICLVYLGKPQRMSLICLVFSGPVSAPEPWKEDIDSSNKMNTRMPAVACLLCLCMSSTRCLPFWGGWYDNPFAVYWSDAWALWGRCSGCLRGRWKWSWASPIWEYPLACVRGGSYSWMDKFLTITRPWRLSKGP